MRLFPRTLFGRTALVIAALLIVTQVLTVQVINRLLAEARSVKVAALEAERAQLALAADALLLPGERQRYRDELQQDHGIVIADAERPGRVGPSGGFLGALARQVERRMGPGSEVRWSIPPQPRGMWIKDSQRALWVFIPNAPIRSGFRTQLAVTISVTLVLTLGGALLLVWRINRPLRILSEAADGLGRGEQVPTIPERGPEEIRRLSARFNEMMESLRHAEAERKLMLAGISHDVRIPLTRLRLGLEMLAPAGTDAQTSELIGDVETIGSILDQFLAFAQDGRELPHDAGSLNELLCEVASRYATRPTPPQLRLTELPTLKFHALGLQRLFSNLIDNAYRHGGGQVEIETRRDEKGVVVDVRDRGPGIAHIAAALEGGLGLTIAQRMAQWHGGEIVLQNRAGGGLHAQVRLLLREAV